MHKWLELSFHLVSNLEGKAAKYQVWHLMIFLLFTHTYLIFKAEITSFLRALEAVEGSTDSDDSESSESLGKDILLLTERLSRHGIP